MRLFIGMDVSLAKTAICVVSEHGKIVREAEVASEPEPLLAWLQALEGNIAALGLEAVKHAYEMGTRNCTEPASCWQPSADHGPKREPPRISLQGGVKSKHGRQKMPFSCFGGINLFA